MRQKPKSYADSFWGDLANALTLRPVYRPPVEAPVATATVTLQSSTAEESAADEQAEAERSAAAVDAAAEAHAVATFRKVAMDAALGEEPTVTAVPMVIAGSTVQQKANPTSSVQQKASPSSTVSQTRTFTVQRKEPALGVHPKAPSIGEFQRSLDQNPPIVRKLPPTLGRGYYTLALKPVDSPDGPPSEAVAKEFERLLGIAQERVGKRSDFTSDDVPDTTPVFRTVRRVRRVLRRKRIKADDIMPLGFSEREAKILEGISQGRTNRAIAHHLGISVRTVEQSVHRMMVKVEVNEFKKLLEAVRGLQDEWRRTSTVTAPGLALKIKHGPTVEAKVIVSHHNPTLIQRPERIEIPDGHHDHPANDEGAKKGMGQQSKRTPAHSADTPPPRKPE